MAEREKGNLATTRTKVRIVADAQGMGALLHGSNNSTFDLVFASGFDKDHLQPEALHRDLRQFDVVLHEARIVWIHKEGNPGGAGKRLLQQLYSLGYQFDPHKSGSRDISARATEAKYETRADGIGGGREHNRDR